VSGTVSAEVKNQPWDLAFHAVLESQGLADQSLPGGIINVANKKDLAAADSTVPLETRLVRVNYARAASLVPAVQSIVTKSRGAVVADSGSNALVITDVQTSTMSRTSCADSTCARRRCRSRARSSSSIAPTSKSWA